MLECENGRVRCGKAECPQTVVISAHRKPKGVEGLRKKYDLVKLTKTQILKRCLALALLVSMSTGSSVADPAIPWATPQTFPDQADENQDVPIFERVIKEEKWRQKQGLPPRASSSVPNSNPAPKLDPNEFHTLKQGSQGAWVKKAQKALLALGFGLPAGPDGDFGGQTISAVKAFQSSLSEPLTGELDKETFDKLMSIAPQGGNKIWEDFTASQSIPEAPLVKEKKARVLIDLSEHRLSVYDSNGKVQRVFPVASGASDTPTDVGTKVVTEKLADPTALAEKLWPESKGTAFGNRLIDLNWYNPDTGTQSVSDEELHGTLVLNSIGSYASHGCVRLTNDSIEWLYQNLSVGDLVVIRD